MNMNTNVKLKYLRNVPIHTLLLVGSLFMVYPLVYSLAASLTSLAEFIRSTWIPVPMEWAFKNYREMFHPKMVPLITQSVGVTLLRTFWYIAMTSITSVLCGYVFARLRFKGKEVAFLVLLSSMLVPAIVFQVPIFVMLARWPLAGGNNILGQGGSGFINQMPALLMGGWISAYAIFLLRQTFYGIPSDYEEAARMDGASFLQTLRYIYLPMLTPVLMVIVISTFVANWNDYTWPLMSVGGNSKLFPVGLFFQRIMAAGLPIATTTVTTANTITNTPLLLTAGVIASVPPVLCFFIFQRYFIEGLQGVGIKG